MINITLKFQEKNIYKKVHNFQYYSTWFLAPISVSPPKSMKKVVDLLVKTPENLYGKRKKHVHWVTVVIKSFLHLNRYYHRHPMRNSHPWYQIYSNGVDNDDISQCAYVINQHHNVNPPKKILKRRQRKNVGLLLQNMKSYMSHNGHKNIPNNIMGCNPLPTMGIL
jgi:hypothetical protein